MRMEAKIIIQTKLVTSHYWSYIPYDDKEMADEILTCWVEEDRLDRRWETRIKPRGDDDG